MTSTPNIEFFNNDWCRRGCDCGKQRGSDSRYQMRSYALAVAVALNGSEVCHCGAPISLINGEVDRTAAGCYRPGYVVMTCVACNNDRTEVPEFDTVAFERDVLAASFGIGIIRKSDARREYEAATEHGATVRRSRYCR